MKPTIIDAIRACQEEKDSTVRFTIRYDSLESISDLSGVTRFQDEEPILGEFPFTFDDVLAKKDKLIAEYDAQEYARQRALAYPSLSDQMDMIMKDNRDGTKTHQTACEAVKKKYPKG